MRTTAVYIELVIIGMESFVWIALAIVNIMGLDIIDSSITNNGSLILLMFFLAICYVFGIISDRIADGLFQKIENNAIGETKISPKSTLLIWDHAGHKEYFDYLRSKIRILRSTALNIIPTTFLLCTYIYLHLEDLTKKSLIFFLVISLGIVIFTVCWKSVKRLYYDFYTRGKNLEVEIEKLNKQNVNVKNR